MSNEYRFDYCSAVARWKTVDVRSTIDIAHRCTTGATFTGSTKTDVIRSMAKPSGFYANSDKFCRMMDAMAVCLPKLKKEFNRELYRCLNEIEKEAQP